MTPPLDILSRSHFGPTWPEAGTARQCGNTPPGGGRNGFQGERQREYNGGQTMSRQMTPAQRRKAVALIRTTYCNYDKGNCIALDDGEECVCVQSISYTLICKWFLNAVLPADRTLYAEIMGQGVKRCAVCGGTFAPRSNRAKYCKDCARRVHRRQKNASDRKHRGKADN